MKNVVALTKKVGPSDLPVLIAGETGTGKEVVAELIHANSKRSKKEMVCINCAGLPAELVESELFGSTKGSFTGGVDRVGLFKHADSSTAFLDELSEMPLYTQAKLLRFIQNKRIRRVGNVGEEAVDVRIIAAINTLPQECVKQKRLREDLYYRLSTVTINMPPLRTRQEDILPLAVAYLKYYSAHFNHQPPVLDSKTKTALLTYQWPGNVRQLQNEMNRCALLCEEVVKPSDLHLDQFTPSEIDLKDWLTVDTHTLTELERVEAMTIVKAMSACDFNLDKTSTRLGMGRSTLYKRVKAWGIKNPANVGLHSVRSPHHNATSNQKHSADAEQYPAPDSEQSDEQSTESFSGESAEQPSEDSER